MTEKRWNVLILVLSSIAIILSLTVLLMCRSLTNRLTAFVSKIDSEQEESIDFNGYYLDSMAKKLINTMGYADIVNSIESYDFSFSDVDETNKTATVTFSFSLDEEISDSEVVVTYIDRWKQIGEKIDITAASENGKDYTCAFPVKYSRPFTNLLTDPYYISVRAEYPDGRIEQITRTPIILRLEDLFNKNS